MSDIDNLITGMDDGDADDSTELQRLKEELDAQRAELDKRSRDLNKGFM
jgi:DNA-binding transcriptional MerR regulator